MGDVQISEKMKNLIRNILVPNPLERPTINKLMQLLLNWQNVKDLPLSTSAESIKAKNQNTTDFFQNGKSGNSHGVLTMDDIASMQQKI